jgi:hypothetical protein
VEMFPSMCTHYDEDRRRQISIDAIRNALNTDVVANWTDSALLLYAFLKALDNAMRRLLGFKLTNGYVMGDFSQRILRRFSVSDFWRGHAAQLPAFTIRCAAAQDEILRQTLAHMHSQV